MKSPLKDKPLRNPGQSGDDYIQNYLLDKAFPPILVAAMLALLAFLEWYKWATNSPPMPILMTILAVIAAVYAVISFIYARKKIRALKLGRDGEIVVGQELEPLIENGAKIFHDIPGDGFNLDHVIIHKSGIYVVETKTFSKPEKGNPEINYRDGKIYVNGKEKDRDAVKQVRAACDWLKKVLKESTGKECNPKPVLVFPGWYVKKNETTKKDDLWVLNPKALPAFIFNSKECITNEDINLFSFHLSRYIKSKS